MLQIRPMPTLIAATLLFLSGCSDLATRFGTPAVPVDVIEAAPIAPITEETPTLPAVLATPELIYLEPLPPPPKHVVTATAFPSGTTDLNTVQSMEVEVTVEGGPVGTRAISVIFVSPLGLVWQRQRESIDVHAGEAQVVHFSLPVAATFIEEQQLSGQWQLTTLDGEVEQATTNFTLARAAP